jgi:hypothetical protein
MGTTARMQEVGQRMEQLPRGVSETHHEAFRDGFRFALPILRPYATSGKMQLSIGHTFTHCG